MIIIEDKQRILNLNHMAIYLMVTADEMSTYGNKLNNLNTFGTLTRNIFRFEVVEKGSTPYEKMPIELTRATQNSNILVRLINSIHDVYCYGLDYVDLSLGERDFHKKLNDIVNDICEKNIMQLDILCSRSTSTSIKAIQRYTGNSIAKDVFERALRKERIPKDEHQNDQLMSIAKTTDMPESLEIAKDALTNPYSDKIERERCEREAPTSRPRISVTVKNVPTGKFYRNGRPKICLGFEFVINGDVIPFPVNKIDQTFLYSAVLLANREGIHLRRRDFTNEAPADKKEWLQRLFSALSFDGIFYEWLRAANNNGPAARINDAKSKIDKALWEVLSDQHKDAYYYCCLITEKPRTQDTRYKIRIDSQNIHFDPYNEERLR